MTARAAPGSRYKRRHSVPVPASKLPEVLTADQAASMLAVGINKVRELVASGQIPRLPLGGHAIRVAKSSVLAYIERTARELEP